MGHHPPNCHTYPFILRANTSNPERTLVPRTKRQTNHHNNSLQESTPRISQTCELSKHRRRRDSNRTLHETKPNHKTTHQQASLKPLESTTMHRIHALLQIQRAKMGKTHLQNRPKRHPNTNGREMCCTHGLSTRTAKHENRHQHTNRTQTNRSRQRQRTQSKRHPLRHLHNRSSKYQRMQRTPTDEHIARTHRKTQNLYRKTQLTTRRPTIQQ